MSAARRGRIALAALALWLSAAAAAAGAPGGLDPGFAVDGRRTFGYGGDDRATDVAALPDGRVVTAGWTTVNGDLAVTRLTRLGALDAPFGRAGTSDIDLGADDRANAVAVQRDGKVVVVGRTLSRAGDMVVLRLRRDGSPDPAFGRGGARVIGSARSDAAYDVAIRPDGRIVVVGDGGAGADMVAVRLTRRGALDRRFGRGGRTAVDLGGIDRAGAVALQRDGGIVLAGTTTEGDDAAVVRLRPDGALDRRFGARGRRLIDAGGRETAEAVAVRPDGGIVVAGSTSAGGDMLVARLRPDGSLDRRFAGRGLRRVDFGGEDLAFDMALAPGGRIVLAGRDGAGDMAVARLRPGGRLDRAFGRAGRATVDFGGRDTALGLALTPAGRIVIAGASDVRVAVARLLG